MIPPNHFETSRLSLRSPSMNDAQALFEGYAQDPDVTRYLIWKPHTDLHVTQAFLDRCLKGWSDGSGFAYVIVRRSDGRIIGMLDLGADGGIGYVLEKASWGQGLMPEALRPVFQWALGAGEYAKLWAHCDVDNPASAWVMTKVGMAFECRLARHTVHPNLGPEPRDMLRYSIVR